MAYTIQLRENPRGKVLGTKGPYPSLAKAQRAAQPIADQHPSKAVTIVPARAAKTRGTTSSGVRKRNAGKGKAFQQGYAAGLKHAAKGATYTKPKKTAAKKRKPAKRKKKNPKRRRNAPLKGAVRVWNALDKGEMPKGLDVHAAGELRLYADNDYQLYQMKQNAFELLDSKRARGKYDPKKAPQLMMYLADTTAKKYTKEFYTARRGFGIFGVPERAAVAWEWAREYEQEGVHRNPGRRRNQPTVYKGHAISESRGVYTVEPYGWQFNTRQDAEQWLDGHVQQSSAAYRFNPSHSGYRQFWVQETRKGGKGMMVTARTAPEAEMAARQTLGKPRARLSVTPSELLGNPPKQTGVPAFRPQTGVKMAWPPNHPQRRNPSSVQVRYIHKISPRAGDVEGPYSITAADTASAPALRKWLKKHGVTETFVKTKWRIEPDGRVVIFPRASVWHALIIEPAGKGFRE
jgi:hypothetical protein